MSRNALSLTALLALSASIAACAVGPDSNLDSEDVESRGRPIVGGSAATAYPEAVLVDMKQNGKLAAYCSGTLIAPKVVLTAGHCVYQFTGWDITAPNASGQKASATSGATFDWKNTSESVNPNMHDLGLIFLSTPINLTTYPTLASAPLANGASIVNIGRINNGTLSTTNLYVSKSLTVSLASSQGFPYDYIGNEIIESGDSGGPDMAAGTHTIVAVNSGAGGGTEVLARVDLELAWIQQQVAAHGGFATGTGTGTGGGGAGGSTGTGSSSSSSSSSGGGAAATCAHAECTAGAKLATGCDPCVTAVCSADSYCCSTKWDAQCVSEVPTYCGTTCGGSSSSASSGGGTSSSSGGSSSACGSVTYAGECSKNTVIWCENGALQQEACGSKTCGYDKTNAYYNCL